MTELSLHILDIVQNSISAKATVIDISIIEDANKDIFSITIEDNGKGMDNEILEIVTDAFYTSRTTRKVGLGLPLFKQAAEICGGNLSIESFPGKGTRVIVIMGFNHIDRQPLGDMAGVMAQLAGSNPAIDFIYSHQTNFGKYVFDTRSIKEILGDIPINNASIYNFIREMIKENLNEIKIGY